MRPRLRDWPMRVYKFPIYPLGDIPQELWTIGHSMQEAWNVLAKAWHDLYKEMRPDVVDEAGNYIKQEKRAWTSDEKARWTAFFDSLKNHIADMPLHWAARDSLCDRFETTCKNMKNGGKPPRKHFKLEKIAIPLRFSGGGLPVERIFSRRSGVETISILAIDAEAYMSNKNEYRRQRTSSGMFGLPIPVGKNPNGTTKCNFVPLQYKIGLHREIPTGAIVKKTVIIGKKDIFGWRWQLDLICEIPTSNIKVVRSDRVAALDIGWRKFESYIRIGMVSDLEGNAVELRLPTNVQNKSINSYNDKYGFTILQTFDDIIVAQSRLDKLTDQVKEDIKDIVQIELNEAISSSFQSEENKLLLQEIKRSFTYIQKMRQGGIVRLSRMLVQAGIAPGAVKIIQDWLAENDRLARRIQAGKYRIVGQRQWLYYNIANWLCRRYGKIVWEGDLNIKQMAEAEDKSKQLSAADRYRHYAAIGEFRRILKLTAAKHETVIVGVKAKGTSSNCSVCGEFVKLAGAKVIACSKGHMTDRDLNATKNLLVKDDETLQLNNLIYKHGYLKMMVTGKATVESFDDIVASV